MNTEKLIKAIWSDNWAKEWSSTEGNWSIISESFEKRVAVDPLSRTQLYYNDDWLISSDIWDLKNERSGIDYTYFSIVKKFGYNTDDRTPFTNVKRIMPGNLYSFDALNKKISFEYFDFNSGKVSKENIYTLIERALLSELDNFKHRDMALLISGGLDSSILAYFLIKNNIQVNFYTIDNSEDLEYVDRLSKDFGFTYKTIDYSIDDLTDSELINIYLKMRSPVDLGSVIPQYKLFEQIRESIVITGDGADELFGGYRRINDYDSQRSDIYQELPFYHLPRLRRASILFNLNLVTPFLSLDLVRKALSLDYVDRKNKSILKETFRGKIPDYIIDRKKIPLKNDKIVEDKLKYRYKICDLFIGELENENL